MTIHCETSDTTTDHDSDAPPAPLRFERRQEDRWPATGVASVSCVAGEHFGEMYSLKMLDYGLQGMGATSARPIEPGVIVSVGFPAAGGPLKRGVVLRCLP